MSERIDQRRAGVERAPAWLVVASAVALAAVIGAQIFGFRTSPPDMAMGDLQKIMYVHVPAAWNAFLAFFVVFWASVVYLWRRTERADLLAASAAEVGAVFTGLTLLLGSIWGRPTWGVWWTWDARLTSTAVLFIIFVGYLALRSFTDDPDRRGRWSAAVGIFGALNVPIVYMSVRWWRTLHQVQSTPETLSPAYRAALRLNGLAFLLLLIVFIAWRYRAARIERRAELVAEEAALQGSGLHV
ncbi:MAG: cytochrome c biogenesis protein CcsA [Gemmatimonadetes bacterium]|nr:cytochrome c biogenesis protein CcsA [Gemmatimonadota bacterium]